MELDWPKLPSGWRKKGENQAPMANKHIHRLLFPEGSINQDIIFFFF